MKLLNFDHLNLNVKTKSEDYTLTADDDIIVFSLPAVATLPPATGSKKSFTIYNNGIGTVTIDGYQSDTIAGSLTESLYPLENLTIIDYSVNKWI